jgi:hypothetical protein
MVVWRCRLPRTVGAILVALSASAPAFAQGRPAKVPARGRSALPSLPGDTSGRRQAGRPVTVQTEACRTDDIRCRVVEASSTTIQPGLFVPGDELRHFPTTSQPLAVLICPCGGGDCLPYPGYGWPEADLGHAITSASRHALSFHLSQATTQFLSNQPLLSFRLQWSLTGRDDRGQLESSEIVTFGKGFARPAAQGTCQE